MRKIHDAKGDLIAVHARVSEFEKGYGFLSESGWGLQVGINVYEGGNSCAPHEHLGKTEDEVRALVGQAMEVLYFVDGRCEMDIFSPTEERIETFTAESGDIVFLVKGWHGLRFLTKTKILECKQGPYISREKDKRFLPL